MNICTIVNGFLEITSLCTQNIAALGSIFGEILKMHIHLHLKSSYQFTLMRLTHYFNSSTKDKHKLETFVSQHTTWVWAREVEVWIYTEYSSICEMLQYSLLMVVLGKPRPVYMIEHLSLSALSAPGSDNGLYVEVVNL